MNRHVFVWWVLLNTLFGAALATLRLAYTGNIHNAALLALACVFAVYALGSYRLGRKAWSGARAGNGIVSLTIILCPMVAMMGTVSGFLVALSGDEATVQQAVRGASSGLAATFVGIACMAMLMIQRHVVTADGS